MKLKKTVKFSLSTYKKPLFIYYSIIIGCLLVGLLAMNLNTDHTVKIGGLELTTIIFVFVMGLTSFRSELYLYLQNGISRKTACISYFITAVVVTLFMAFVESMCYTIIGKNSTFQSAFLQVYTEMSNRNFLYIVATSFLWNFFVYFAASIVGYCIAALYYRMNRVLKLSVSIGVPVTFLIILPLIDEYLAKGAIGDFAKRAALFIVGVNGTTYHPIHWMIFCLIVTLLSEGISYRLVKEAVIKSK
ncbi:MAG: hypothetical protein PUC65_14815 [Clostridiales bacterium]|nr:hypothetical protein [Clostridiales bacterium]